MSSPEPDETPDLDALEAAFAETEPAESTIGSPEPAEPTIGSPESPEPTIGSPESPESVVDEPELAESPVGSDLDEPGLPTLARDDELTAALEALLLVVDSPVDEASLASALDQPVSRVERAVRRLAESYRERGSGVDLRRVGAGWRFYTRDLYAPYVERFLLDGQRATLTRAALETLAVVAYRQPVTRARVSAVRGVNCDGVLRTLLTRGLVEEAGVDGPTQGTLFRTTELFLERLGLSSLEDLPPLAPLLPDIDAIDEL
ncbi:SMC-Scp complex subunit ScpB [Pseudonocardia ailaonensis]|uniref:SMC-Scp complex subunit ScpB n=1 Tax=Pseudonocardia ailaonensis TaxID=367279 RepID=A0ABN2NGS6_9PSEU